MSLNKRDTKKLIKSIQDMNVKSENFFEIYKAVSNKYWDFPNADEEMKARCLVQKYAERGDPAEIQITVRVAGELIKMAKENKQACKMHFEFEKLSYTVDVYQDGIARDQIEELINHAGKLAKEKFKLKKVDDLQSDA